MAARQSLFANGLGGALRQGAKGPSGVPSATARRTLHSSKAVRNAPHPQSAASSTGYSETAHESFATPLYRNLLILTIGGVAVYRLSLLHAQPHPSRASSSGRSAPGNESEDDHNEEIQGDDRPFLTRYIEGWMTPASFWQERTAHHVDVHKDQAELKLFLQDAERPPIHRMRFPQSMGMGSPHCRPVGGQVDMKDLNVRSGSEY